MGFVIPTSTLVGNYVRIYPGDTALLREDEVAMNAALVRFHEVGDWNLIEPYVKKGEKVTKFHLRHLRGRVALELDAVMAPTLHDRRPSSATIVKMAHLSIARVEDWDGTDADGKAKPLHFRPHADYPMQVMTAESFDDLCDVAGGELVAWLGGEAWHAHNLRPL